MTKLEQIKQVRKASANTFYDNVIIAFKSNRKLRKKQPNLLNELRFHRDNYYLIIDKHNHSDGKLSHKYGYYGEGDKKAKGIIEK